MDPTQGRQKQLARHGGHGGVNVGMSPRELARLEMKIEMAGRSIRPDACPGTPEELTLFDNSYMVQYPENPYERRCNILGFYAIKKYELLKFFLQ